MLNKVQIVIPTMAGRERYLHWAIVSCLDQRNVNVEVLVSNNGGAASVRDCVEAINDSRVKYIETNHVLPMSIHWEFALSHVTGDVISIIGDDDAIVPDALSRVIEQFKLHPEISALTHYPAQYYWPDFPITYYQNRYALHIGSGASAIKNTQPLLQEVAEFRNWYGNLPYLYHGFVRREALEKIRIDQGKIFARIAPDIYSDLLLAASLGSFLQLDCCLTVGGQGAKSNGVNFALNTDIGKGFVEDLPALLVPNYSVGSIYLQVFEYIDIVRRAYKIYSPLRVKWARFIILVLSESVRNPAYRISICNDLVKISKTNMPKIYRYLAGFLVSLVRISLVASLFKNVFEMRAKYLSSSLEDAHKKFGAKNVYELAKEIATISREK